MLTLQVNVTESKTVSSSNMETIFINFKITITSFPEISNKWGSTLISILNMFTESKTVHSSDIQMVPFVPL